MFRPHSLLVAKATFEMRRHMVFDDITVAGDVAREVGLLPPLIKIAVPDLSVVIGAHRVVALTDVHHNMHVLGEPLDGEIDGSDRRADLVVSCHRKIRFVDLNVLTARLRKASQVLAEQFAEIAYHSPRCRCNIRHERPPPEDAALSW